MSINFTACNLAILFLLFLLSPGLMAQAPTAAERKRISEISTSRYTEFAPTISADGKTLIFESNKNKTNPVDEHWELFESRLDEKGVWSEPHPITAINEKCNFLAGPSLSHDGNTIYFTAFIEGVTTSEDIFYSTRLDNKNWSAPISIGNTINTEEYEGFPSISANGNSLYFLRVNEANIYDKKNKENCFTIYVSHKSQDGLWKAPVALPASINSGCERDPKIMADNHTLIFSSIRPGNKGKFDMYQSRLQPDESWSDPQPLDFINSPDNDQSPCIPAAGDVMYFCSNNDIYSVSIPKADRQLVNTHVQGIVRAAGTKTPLAADIRVIDASTKEVVSTFKSNADGYYSLILGSTAPYSLEFGHKSYFAGHADFDFRKQESYKEVTHDIELTSDYMIKVDIKDKDLGFGVSSFLIVADNTGQVIYKDSVRAADLPLKLNVNSTKQYAVSVNAPLYAGVNQPVKFDAATFGPEVPFAITLEHEKVGFATDVTDVSTKQKMRTKVYYNNEDRNEVIVAEDGETVYLRKGDRYQVVTSSDKGYLFSSTTVLAGDATNENNTPESITLHVTPVKAGVNLTLNHITFPSNSAELKPSSFIELDRVADLLTNNPNVAIEISAHTDDVGNDDYNNSLSEKRAQSVLEYLKKKKINPQQLITKGYGETRPVVPNDSDANRERNRRVELVILNVN
jgi:outer membrane protein OmpA-like peptidoglycan-associated protein/Tol biopolymer transport system component